LHFWAAFVVATRSFQLENEEDIHRLNIEPHIFHIHFHTEFFVSPIVTCSSRFSPSFYWNTSSLFSLFGMRRN